MADKRDAGVALLCTQAKRGATIESEKTVIIGSLQIRFAGAVWSVTGEV
jgi:hypothetical protein